MDDKTLANIRNSLYMLPDLNKRLEDLKYRIYDAEKEVQSLLSKFNEETHDVEKLEKESLSVTILKLVGKYENRLDKEMQEALAAKVSYDKAVDMVKELKNQYDEALGRISKLQEDRRIYEKELQDRENQLLNNINDEASIKYKELEALREQLAKELLETKEAYRAAERAINTAETARDHLESADDWASYDVWTKGGIFSHIAKYDHIDEAQSEFNRLAAQLKELQKELTDVNLFDKFELNVIDDTTRMVDFWFDNIFTDLNVRDKIRDDLDQLYRLDSQVNKIIKRLENKSSEINKKLEEIEEKKKDLLIND